MIASLVLFCVEHCALEELDRCVLDLYASTNRCMPAPMGQALIGPIVILLYR